MITAPTSVCDGLKMPLLRKDTIHGWRCSFYDNDRVMVGTSARSRFPLNVPADETSWFATRLRAELIERELATAEELPMDEDGEAAMAACNAAKLHAAALTAASKVARQADSKRARLEAALEAAMHHEETAGVKRERAELELQLAEGHHRMATTRVKVAKVQPVVAEMAKTNPTAAALQTKLDSFFRGPRA